MKQLCKVLLLNLFTQSSKFVPSIHLKINYCKTPVSNMTALSTQTKCRNGFYPPALNKVQRFHVPDDKVLWKVSWDDYKPVKHTAQHILSQPWADPEIDNPDFHPKWNELDGKVNRVSYNGTYEILDNMPRNPIGRTGITGRGLLGRWGPNHAADPIVTRWKRDADGNIIKDEISHKPIIQFVCIERRDCHEWAFPGGMVDPGEKVSQTLKREFSEEALNSLCLTDEEKRALEKTIGVFFSSGNVVYEGYIDDHRNTDNSWMESSASNFHDDDGNSVGKFPLHAGDDAASVQWQDASSSLCLYASHGTLLKCVVEKHGAHW